MQAMSNPFQEYVHHFIGDGGLFIREKGKSLICSSSFRISIYRQARNRTLANAAAFFPSSLRRPKVFSAVNQSIDLMQASKQAS